jgi:hypothetical protein
MMIRIRIPIQHFWSMRIRIQIQGFHDQKLQFTSLASMKDVQAMGEALSSSQEKGKILSIEVLDVLF